MHLSAKIYQPPSLSYVLLACLLSLGASVVAFHLLQRYESLRNTIQLVMDVEASEPGRWELFWDTGNGFNAAESDSFHVRIPNLRSTGSFRLPHKEIRQFRLDPMDRPGTGTIYSIRIENGLGESLLDPSNTWQLQALNDIASVETFECGIRIESNAEDPYGILHCDIESPNPILTLKPNFHPSLVVWCAVAICVICMIGFFMLGTWMLPSLLALILWIIVYPGSFSPDSISHLNEASLNLYSNWHPVILPILLRGFFTMGFTPSLVVLMQTLSGTLGIYALVREIYASIRHQPNPHRHDLALFAITAGIFTFLFSPLTPFTGFLTTLWKDVWFSIALLWITSLSIRLLRQKQPGRWTFPQIARFSILCFLLVLSLLLRGNAIVLLPLYLCIVWLLSRSCQLGVRLSFVAVVLLLPFLTQNILSRHFIIRDTNPRSSVMALELAGVLYIRPDLKSSIPYVAENLKPGWTDHFQWAGYRFMIWGEAAFAKAELVKSEPNPDLEHAYFHTVRSHPLLISYVKLRNFAELLNPFKTTEWFPFEIAENTSNLERNRYATDIHQKFQNLSWQVISHPILRWISGVHLIWLGFPLVGFVMLLRLRGRNPDLTHHDLLWILLLLPIAYTVSYLLACPWVAFRYIYPSTLLIQISVMAAVLTWGIQVLRCRSGCGQATVFPHSRKE